MSNETQLARNSGFSSGAADATDGESSGRPVDQRSLSSARPDQLASPAKKFQFGRFASQTFRGRYFVLTILGLITGALTAPVGWQLSKPIYHSEGLVRIAYSLPEVIAETDQNRPLQMFDTFMQSQKMLITSRRAIDKASQDPIWSAMKKQVPASPDKYFADNLTVDLKGRSEFIRIVVTDYDPGTAAAAATSITNAYVDLYKEREERYSRERLGKLEDGQSRLQTKIDDLDGKIKDIAAEFGTTNLDVFYDAQFANVARLESRLSVLRNAMETAAPTKTPGNPEKKGEAKPLTLVQIGAFDPVTQALLTEQNRLQVQLDDLESKGYGEGHPQVLQLKSSLVRATARVEKAAKDYREIREVIPSGPDMLNSPTAGKSLEDLQADATRAEKKLKECRDEMVRIGTTQRKARNMEAEVASLRIDQSKLTDRLRSLKTEDSLGGRLSVFSTGEIPLSPDKDPRIRLAAATGFAGLTLPWSFMLLMGFAWRKFRYSDDMEGDAGGSAPLLGILPELDDNGGDRDEMLAAAHSIHQVRVSLQARATQWPQTYLITSATAGEGKTSLTLSLGLSFAVSKQRTLVIDGDLVGRHLTSKLDLQGMDGLHEALVTGRIESLLQKTDDGLYVLTAGKAGSQHAYAIPAAKFRALLTEAKRHFDVILIDTGPILGSVEAAVLAQEVDGVIFAITRGQQQRLVAQAMARLNSLKIRIVGLIFNRAKPEDFRRSPYGSSYRSMSVPPTEEATKSRIDGLNAFGPLVSAVDVENPKGRG